VIANVMAGIDYQKYHMQQVMGGVKPMHKSTWYSYQEEVYNADMVTARRDTGTRADLSLRMTTTMWCIDQHGSTVTRERLVGGAKSDVSGQIRGERHRLPP
jgi:hypothetical protein